jgi:hypothetical protein
VYNKLNYAILNGHDHLSISTKSFLSKKFKICTKRIMTRADHDKMAPLVYVATSTEEIATIFYSPMFYHYVVVLIKNILSICMYSKLYCGLKCCSRVSNL